MEIEIQVDSLNSAYPESLGTMPSSIILKERCVNEVGEGLYFKDKLVYISENSEMAPIYFDFMEYWNFLRKEKKPGPIIKAIGKASPKEIVDGTCGTGKDSLAFLYHGYKIEAYERNPVVYLLLKDALRVFLKDKPELEDKITINYGSLFDQQLENKIVYYDPMYEQLKGKRLSKKNMQVLKQVVGEDIDKKEIIDICQKKNIKKLIFKRPHKAEKIGNINYSVETKLVRFDVYLFS